jgi:translation initiation factor IF-3
VRLVDDENQQLGIVETREALLRAREAGLDLVEVAPQSRPPVCRIMDYGKWKYAQRKKEQKSKSHRHETELKEIRIKTPKIDVHDLSIKIAKAKDFLSRGDRVQFTLRFRGRELAHVDEGQKIYQQIKTELSEVGKIDQDYRFEGKRMTMTLAPSGAPVVAKKPSAPKAPADAARQAPAPAPLIPPPTNGSSEAPAAPTA